MAEIFRQQGEAYRRTHALTGPQRKVMRAIEVCRTAALGGHVHVCGHCAHTVISYNSCRNRHCPKCQSLAQAKWIERRKATILNTHYFHVVFTLPAELHLLAQENPRKIFRLLFSAASRTLLDLGRDEKRLGAKLGVTAVLHTWTRKLLFHPHLHCIVTGGGLSRSRMRWCRARQKYLLPVRVLSRLFRGKFLSALKKAYADGELGLEQHAFEKLLTTLYDKEWVVYAKRPFGGPEQVFTYLGRYTHRVGISNQRILQADDRAVRFLTKDGNTIEVTPDEFIRRFLLHVLPTRFVKIRHFGLMAARNSDDLEVARMLLGMDPRSEPRPKTWRERLFDLTGIDPLLCPACGTGTMHRTPLRCETEARFRDTS